jgi:hypothetical protein
MLKIRRKMHWKCQQKRTKFGNYGIFRSIFNENCASIFFSKINFWNSKYFNLSHIIFSSVFNSSIHVFHWYRFFDVNSRIFIARTLNPTTCLDWDETLGNTQWVWFITVSIFFMLHQLFFQWSIKKLQTLIWLKIWLNVEVQFSVSAQL